MIRSSLRTLVALASLCAAALTQEVPFRTGEWPAESGIGNHRAVIRVEAAADAVKVRIPWRRRDEAPEKIGVLFFDAATGKRIADVMPVDVNREFGEFVFRPETAPGDTYAYYLPYRSTGRSNYPSVKYEPPDYFPDVAWLRANGLGLTKPGDRLPMTIPRAVVTQIQSIDDWNSFSPMEIIATAEETGEILDGHPEAPYLLFPEDREHSIRMSADLPYRWVRRGPGGTVKGEAARGEYFTFQVGVWAARRPIKDLEVRFSDLVQSVSRIEDGSPALRTVIGRSAMTCINKGGSGWDGSSFAKTVAVGKGMIQALWCGIDVAADARPGLFKGTVVIAPEGLPETSIPVELRVTEGTAVDHGDGDPDRMTRLRWLDSRLAFDDEIVSPFIPMSVQGATVHLLGRELTFGREGLPARILSRFSPEMTHLAETPLDLLATPMRLVVKGSRGNALPWKGPSPTVTRKSNGAVAWEVRSTSGAVTLTSSARMEFDGFLDLRMALRAERDTDVRDIVLEIPVAKGVAKYMMGLGFKGGLRPHEFSWAWDRTKNQDALWIGNVNAGLQVSLRAENYSRPLNTNFYLSKPLNLPPSWWNEGRGTVTVREIGPATVLVSAASGRRTLRAGETLHFDITLLVTPFKTIDPAAQFSQRYYHAFKPLDEIAAAGADVVNVHHATEINPFINYPFLRAEAMKAYVDDAHGRGFKVKIYDTIRELSNRAPEIFALRSLGHEIFSAGPGGGFSWLQEHLGGDYIAAWFVPELKDAAIINSGMSRWHNYYIEGLAWLTRNVGIDGLYLDDVAFDRTTMKRVRKVLDRGRPGALIDLHSANQFNPRDGYASSANLYLEHFPFLNRLWFGEYFDYNSRPDYWLVEISGIPFGLMGEMLQDGGNPWRGMLFGMTNRLPWAGDPRPLWKLWDEFGIKDARMIGFWVEGSPVRSDHTDVPVTVYVKKGRVLIALASWADGPAKVKLVIDWKKLGIDPAGLKWTAPAIEGFQEAAEFMPDPGFEVRPGKGLLIMIGK
jgi:hypothetical protein